MRVQHLQCSIAASPAPAGYGCRGQDWPVVVEADRGREVLERIVQAPEALVLGGRFVLRGGKVGGKVVGVVCNARIFPPGRCPMSVDAMP